MNNPYNYLNLQTLSQAYLELYPLNKIYLDRAIELAKELTSLAPTDPETYYTLGLLQLTKGETEKAKKTFEKAIELKNDYIQAQEILNSFQ